MKNWLHALLFLPALGWAQEETVESVPVPADYEGEPPINWVDSSHAFATNQAQALTQWMDGFFGDPEYNIEQAESWLRLETEFEYDEEDGADKGIRLRGKVQLPKISRRVNLVFSGEENENLDRDERDVDDRVGLQVNVRDRGRSRFDVTLGIAGGGLRPGVRYRIGDSISEQSSYRFTQRIQHESDEGFYSNSQLDLYRALDHNSQLRWTNRALWGEETLGVEWRSRIGLRHRLWEESRRPTALSYNFAVNGVTRPEQWVRNYKLSLLVRRQIYRDFLFFEIEPALNYRRRRFEDDREPAWSIVARFEIALEKDLRRVRTRDNEEMTPVDELPPEEQRELVEEAEAALAE